MAKTTKKVVKKEAVTTKRVRKTSTPRNAPEDNGIKRLTDGELRQIEVAILETKNAKLQMATLEQKYNNILLELKLMEVDRVRGKELVVKADREYKTQCDRYEVLIKEIKEKYDITRDNFGYDPDTGEIKE